MIISRSRSIFRADLQGKCPEEKKQGEAEPDRVVSGSIMLLLTFPVRAERKHDRTDFEAANNGRNPTFFSGKIFFVYSY